MTCEKFESVMGYHCSPVLMGMKPANLVSFSKEKIPELPEIISDYEESLEREGIRMEIICGCRKHYLLLVYRPDMLQEYLKQDEARKLLLQDGYNIDGSLDEMIARLKERFFHKTEFPHEIGLFLGYPIEDVKGFRKFGGSGCKLCVIGRFMIMWSRLAGFLTAMISAGSLLRRRSVRGIRFCRLLV